MAKKARVLDIEHTRESSNGNKESFFIQLRKMKMQVESTMTTMRWRDKRINFQCQRVGASNHLQFPAFRRTSLIILNIKLQVVYALKKTRNDLLVFNLVQFVFNDCLTFLLSLPYDSLITHLLFQQHGKSLVMIHKFYVD